MKLDYVNLHRTFSAAAETGEESDRDYLRFLRKRDQASQDWAWLTASRIVVILNEAGAGKTDEIKGEVARQRSAGKAAFLFPIERLCQQPLEQALPADDLVAFRRWLRARGPATIFLDSVDEAKLPQDLDKNPLNAAVRAIETAVGLRRLRNLRLVISSRPSAWTEGLELAEIHRLQTRFEGFGLTTGDGEAPLVRFVRLDPLEDGQIERLAEAAGAMDGFMTDLRLAGGADLAPTPLDVVDLVKAYMDAMATGAEGSTAFRNLETIVDRAIARRALDVDSPNPRSALPLSRTRAGARRLACACVLAQQLSIRLPGSRADGIDPLAVLAAESPDWSLPDLHQLLGGGLFTAAWEGAVRFQHRRLMEHLAAEGFNEMLEAGMALSDLADLLTPSAFGEPTVPGHFLETVGWLATLNPAFRAHVLRIAPQLVMETGDPGSHPHSIREAALRGHVARYDQVSRRGEFFYEIPLRRFASPTLEPVCRELLAGAIPDEPKGHVLDLVLIGGFRGCLPEVVTIACDATASPELRTRATEIAAAFGNAGDLRRIAISMLRFRTPRGPRDGHERYSRNRLRSAVVTAAFPTSLSLREAVAILVRLEVPDRSYLSTTEQELAQVFADACAPAELPRLVRWLRRLCWEKPGDHLVGRWETARWTPRGRFLLPTLQAACVRSLRDWPPSKEDLDLAVEFDRLEAIHRVGGGPLDSYDRAGPVPMEAIVAASPRFRRTIFLKAVETYDRRSLEPMDVVRRLYRAPSVEADRVCARADLDWLEELYRLDQSSSVREAAAKAVSDTLPRLEPAEARVRRARLQRLARMRGEGDLFPRPAWLPYRELRFAVQRWWWDQPLLRYKSARRDWIRNLWRALDLKLHHRAVEEGRDFKRLYRPLWRHGDSDKSIVAVRKALGDELGDIVQTGVKAFALVHESDPDGPRTAGDHLAAIGWSELANDAPDLLVGLAPAQATSVLSVILKDIGFPDWAAGVAKRHPDVWRRIVEPYLISELTLVTDESAHRYSRFLSLAGRQDEWLRRPLAEATIVALEAAQTPSSGDILDAGRIIRTAPDLRPRLAPLAQARGEAALEAGDVARAAPWLAQWLAVEPRSAWRAIRVFRDRMIAEGDEGLVQRLFGAMSGCFDLGWLPVDILTEVAIDLHRHIRPEEDDERSGVVTNRQHAQDLRRGAPTRLSQQTTPEARASLESLLVEPTFKNYGDWLHRLLREQATAAAAKPPWREAEAADFFASRLRAPRNADELQALIGNHLLAIVQDLHTSEFDRRGLFVKAQEKDIRAFFGHRLQDLSRGWYSVTQESVTAGEKRTDLRIEGKTGAGDVVIVELKLANKSWDADQLVGHLETQLVDQYLISRKVRRGIYAIVDLQLQKTWTTTAGDKLDFDGICARLETDAARLNELHPQIDSLHILSLKPLPPKA